MFWLVVMFPKNFRLGMRMGLHLGHAFLFACGRRVPYGECMVRCRKPREKEAGEAI